MSESDDAHRRIPKSLGTDAKIVGRYTVSDLAVALVPGTVLLLASRSVLPATSVWGGVTLQTLGLVLAGVGVICGAALVAVTPAHVTSVQWIQSALGFHRDSRQVTHDRAQEWSRVASVRPHYDAIERTDGAVVGAVQVHPPSMALATDDEWRQKADAFANFLNTTVEFPIQLYSTTTSFPVDRHVSAYERRLDDPDVEETPELATLIEGYTDWYRTGLQQRPTAVREHYVIVTVTPSEVVFDDLSLLARLTRLPVLGTVLRLCTGRPRRTVQTAALDALDDRLQRVEHGLREVEGCRTERLDATALTNLLATYWRGTSDREREPTVARRGPRTSDV